MANMGYCRFQNTLSDFEDCIDNLDNIDSLDEKKAAKYLYDAAKEYIEKYEELEEEGLI